MPPITMVPLALRRLLAPLATLTVVALGACGDSAPADGPARSDAAAPADATASAQGATGLPAPATYRGLLPCADCPGILATLELADDGSGRLSYLYMEGEADRDPVFTDEGRWEIDDAGRLAFQPEGTAPVIRYQREGDDLVALDGEGQPIPSALPKTLTRAPAGPMQELAQTAWRFVEPAPAGGHAAVPSLRLAADGVLTGSDGCNSFRSTWAVDDDGALRFGPLASTRMACPDGDAGMVALRVAEAIAAAGAYRLESEASVLVLLDGAGDVVARLRPTP